jgi:hypothetical protein
MHNRLPGFAKCSFLTQQGSLSRYEKTLPKKHKKPRTKGQAGRIYQNSLQVSTLLVSSATLSGADTERDFGYEYPKWSGRCLVLILVSPLCGSARTHVRDIFCDSAKSEANYASYCICITPVGQDSLAWYSCACVTTHPFLRFARRTK